MLELTGLPGEELIREGLDDLRAGRATVAGCLAGLALPRLKRAGLAADIEAGPELELRLFRLLRERGGDAYGRYNSLLRQLSSFESALDRILFRRDSDLSSTKP
jgi:hypothetical protein